MTADRLTDTGDAVTQTRIARTTLPDVLQRVVDVTAAALDGAAVRIEVPDAKGVSTAWSSDTAAEDASAVTALQLAVDDEQVGVLTVYRPCPDEDLPALTRWARRVAVVVANARDYWQVRELASGLEAALDSRAVIDMAKGKLMAQGGITPDEAFALLVKASQRENVKLRDIAQRIVHGDPDGDADVRNA